MRRKQKQANNVKQKEISCVNHSLQPNLSMDNWNHAAEDARLKIKAFQKKIRLLKQAARVFEKYSEQGEQWPTRPAP
jgi:hypothetical protein